MVTGKFVKSFDASDLTEEKRYIQQKKEKWDLRNQDGNCICIVASLGSIFCDCSDIVS
jgi:hypothetical protein